MVPLKVSGSTPQSGLPQRRSHEDGGPDGEADHRQGIEQLGVADIGDHVGDDGGDEDERHDEHARPFDAHAGRRVLHDGRWRCCWMAAGIPHTTRASAGGNEGVEHAQGVDPIDPHHGGGGVADHAARAAGIGCSDDSGQVADVHSAPEDLLRHRTADQCRRDVVEEARDHCDEDEQHEAALPVVGQEARHLVGDLAFLEVAREQGKAHEQEEQVGEDHGLVRHVLDEARQAGAVLEARKAQLVERDGGETGQGHLQRVVVEQGDAEQRQGEQDEVDGDAGNHHRLWCENPGSCDWRCDQAH